MSQSLRDQTIALAGLFQAAHLVKELAYHGTANTPAVETSLESLLKIDATSAEDIFGGTFGVLDGLKILRAQLAGQPQGRDMEITRYAVALLHLEKKLMKRSDLVGKIQEGIREANAGLEHFPLMHANTQARLADIYKRTISTLNPQIIVNGEQMHLRNPETANKIRALLLAGIRAAVLWDQTGGNRLWLLLRRKRYLATADELIKGSIRSV